MNKYQRDIDEAVAAYESAHAARKANLMHDRYDCAVVAASVALFVPYMEAHRALELAGRRFRSTTRTSTLLKAFPCLVELPLAHGFTLARVTKELPPQHRYVLRTGGHYVAVVGGQVIDTCSMRLRVKKVLRVTKGA